MATLNLEAAVEPEELQGEPRWSSIRYAPHDRTTQCSRATDEKLVLLVTQSTASGERFPVGVNWLEVSQVVQLSPVDCVKRYAFLHDARERYTTFEREHNVELKMERNEEIVVLEEELEGALLDSDEYFEDKASLSDFGSPVASPKLQLLGTFREFETGRPVSPESSPPFAIPKPTMSRQIKLAGPGGSPFRWESLVNDPNYTAPVLDSPPSVRHKQSFQDRFGLEDDEAKALSFASSSPMSRQGFMSPPDSQDRHSEKGIDSTFSSAVLTYALKDLKVEEPVGYPLLDSPFIGSPRLSRKISNSEYPFSKDDGVCARLSAVSSMNQGFRGLERADARAASNALGPSDASAQRPMNAQYLRMSAMSSLSSFHHEDPFSGSVTQSALEDAFLDMAGSRLDASSVLLSSRMSATPAFQSQLRPAQINKGASQHNA